MIVENARWLEPDGRFGEGALQIEDGRLRLWRGEERPAGGAEVLDAAGMLVLPGVIDAHTHLREPGQEYKEGIDQGTKAALAGGVTTVLDMPNNLPPISDAAALERKAALFAQKSRVNWGLHVQAPFEGRPARPYAAAKVYLAKSSALPAVRLAELARVFERHRVVAVHAEDEARFVAVPGARVHHLQRPRAAVSSALEAVEGALRAMPEGARPRVVVCHASTVEEVRWLERMKRDGFDVWGETCPHYCLLTEDDYLREGPRLKVNPPLRSEADRAAVLAGLRDGVLDFLATDHAPHAPQEKADEANAPSGIPGIERTLPLLLHLQEMAGLPWRRVAEAGAARAAACYGLAGRGGIVDGAWADLALVRPRAADEAREVLTRAGYDAYARLPLRWEVEATLVGGRIAYRHGRFSDSLSAKEAIA